MSGPKQTCFLTLVRRLAAGESDIRGRLHALSNAAHPGSTATLSPSILWSMERFRCDLDAVMNDVWGGRVMATRRHKMDIASAHITFLKALLFIVNADAHDELRPPAGRRGQRADLSLWLRCVKTASSFPLHVYPRDWRTWLLCVTAPTCVSVTLVLCDVATSRCDPASTSTAALVATVSYVVVSTYVEHVRDRMSHMLPGLKRLIDATTPDMLQRLGADASTVPEPIVRQLVQQKRDCVRRMLGYSACARVCCCTPRQLVVTPRGGKCRYSNNKTVSWMDALEECRPGTSAGCCAPGCTNFRGASEMRLRTFGMVAGSARYCSLSCMRLAVGQAFTG